PERGDERDLRELEGFREREGREGLADAEEQAPDEEAGLELGPAARHAGDEGERQEEREAAPDVDVLVQRVAETFHRRVAKDLEQGGRQRQEEPHDEASQSARAAGARPR